MDGIETPKRGSAELSPDSEYEQQQTAKKSLRDMEAMMRRLMKETTANLASKEDIRGIQESISGVREENKIIKMELVQLQKKYEEMEKNNHKMELMLRESNVLVQVPNGSEEDPLKAAKHAISELGANVKEEDLRVLRKSDGMVLLRAKLGTSGEASTCLRNSNRVKGTNIFIKRDLTTAQQRIQSSLLKVRKMLKGFDINVGVRVDMLLVGTERFKFVRTISAGQSKMTLAQIFPSIANKKEIQEFEQEMSDWSIVKANQPPRYDLTHTVKHKELMTKTRGDFRQNAQIAK